MSWQNSDGLYVKYGVEEGSPNKGGTYNSFGALQTTEFKFDWTDALSATRVILGTADTGSGASLVKGGAGGILMPRGIRIEQVDVVIETVFTSSGTLATADLQIGLIRNDRTSTYDDDGFTTSTFVGTFLTPVGKKTLLIAGSTGAGAFLGTTLANSGYITLLNSGHASHPLTAGKAAVRIHYYTPQTVG